MSRQRLPLLLLPTFDMNAAMAANLADPSSSQRSQQAPVPGQAQGQLFPMDIIRAETVLSRNPVHNLSKKGSIDIAIHVADAGGRGELQWQVSHNSRYGAPGPLAYRVDTLVVNRRIEQAGRPVPKIIRLGSLSEICAELGLGDGKSTQDVKKALLQNAFAGISAKLTYTGSDGTEHTFEFHDTRYGVVLNGQKFPDGRKANAVYLVLHDTFRALLDRAPVRPMDYAYMKALTPGAQRFYELVSYQIFAAVKFGRPVARYRYSDYCTFAPQTRYLDWEHVRKQMFKLHVPHLDSGYLKQVEYETTVDSQGQPDWWFGYVPGQRAIDEFNGFASRRRPRMVPVEPAARGRRAQTTRPSAAATQDLLPLELPGPAESLVTGAAGGKPPVGVPDPARSLPAAPELSEAEAKLVAELVQNELNRDDAERFARERPQECRRQLDFLPHVPEFTSSRGAYLRAAIAGSFGPPKGYGEQARRGATQRKQQERATLALARQSHEKAHQAAYLAWVGERVGELERSAPEAVSGFQDADAQEVEKLSRQFARTPRILRETLLDRERPDARAERLTQYLAKHHPEHALPTFWQWDREHNPAPFTPPMG